MSQKRGRPPSYTDDNTLSRRRQLTAARTRAYRERRRGAQLTRPLPTPREPLPYGERIVDLAFNEWDAAETLSTLGLRTQGLTLPQDPQDAQLQARAIPIDEHHELYRSELTTYEASGAVEPSRSNAPSRFQDTPSRLTSFFPTLPPRNPFQARADAIPPIDLLDHNLPPTETPRLHHLAA